MAQPKPAVDYEVGESYAPLSFRVTPELNQQYLFGQEDFHSRYIEGSESGPPLVHPALILNMSNRTRSPSFFMPEGESVLQAKDEFEFLSPAAVGRELTVRWTVAERYERRGREYMVTEARVMDEDGTEILRRRITSTRIKGQ